MGVTEPDTLEASLAALGAERWRATIGAVDVHFGAGERFAAVGLVQELGARRPLIVTDPGVRATGHVDALVERMRMAQLDTAVFDAVIENPTTDCVKTACRAVAAHEADLIVGFGGGSAMDTAKGANYLFTNGGRMEDYEGRHEPPEPLLPSLGIPTTAGTGSEAQSYALISRVEDHRKMACGADGLRFRAAMLDPELTATVPRSVRVATGIDALAHAVETLVCRRANPISRLFSRRAWKLLADSFAASVARPDDDEARAAMLLGAHLAGAAIESSMLGAAHACANPLTARFGITHGIAVGLMLPHVVRYNMSECGAAYAQLSADLPGRLEALMKQAGVATRLRDHGVGADAAPMLAGEAAAQWTGRFNPRPLDAEEAKRLYEEAY